ncbi:Polyadenylate-binding protein rbp45 [Ranunculus cassubicifolius]
MMQQPGNPIPPPTQQPMDQQQQHYQIPPPHQQQPWMMMPPQQPQVWNQQIPPPQQVAGQPPQMVAQQQYQQPQLQQQQQYSHPQQGGNTDEIKTLWIGDLQYWMDESYLTNIFSQTNELASAKVIRNKQTGQSESYGFIEFVSRAAAEKILQTYNGTPMPSTEQNFRLNWATLGSGEKRGDDSADYTIFVGDLASDVSDYTLQETFKVSYPSVKGAKVVTDRVTGRSKGYGFVKFSDEGEQIRAMTEMNGQFCSTRPMRIGPATNKKNIVGQPQYPKATYQNTDATQNENDPNNTTIFVGGLDSNVTDDHLRQVFSQFGELVHVKIPVGKRCGFVQFSTRPCAEEALLMLNGTQLGGQSIRLSWGRSPSNKQQPQPDPNQWNGAAAAAGGYYGYNQGYEQYGYAPPAQDPNMYAYGAAAYQGYGNYPQQQ